MGCSELGNFSGKPEAAEQGAALGVRLWHWVLGNWRGAEQLLALALACVLTDNVGPCTFHICCDVP